MSKANKTEFLDKSANLIIQGLSLVLWALALAGLEVNPEETASGIVTHITANNMILLAIALGNLGLIVYKWIRTWKTDQPNFALFLKSINWWASLANFVGAILLSYDIVLPPGTLDQVVALIFEQKYWEMAGLVLVNIVPVIVKKLTEKKVEPAQVNLN
jgi:hypothetical protein